MNIFKIERYMQKSKLAQKVCERGALSILPTRTRERARQRRSSDLPNGRSCRRKASTKSLYRAGTFQIYRSCTSERAPRNGRMHAGREMKLTTLRASSLRRSFLMKLTNANKVRARRSATERAVHGVVHSAFGLESQDGRVILSSSSGGEPLIKVMRTRA